MWETSRPRFDSDVVGPHVEHVCRAWVERFAEREAFGGPVAVVGRGVVNDPANRRTWEVDVVVQGSGGSLLAIGEAKLGAVMGADEVERLAGTARRRDSTNWTPRSRPCWATCSPATA